MAKQYKKIDIYQDITDRMLDALERKRIPWIKPWDSKGTSSALPENFTTGKQYRGINVLLLWNAAEDGGFTSNQWVTYKQAQSKGGQVRKGSRGTQIVFWQILKKDKTDAAGNVVTNDNGEPVKDAIPMGKYYTVFNMDQVDGIDVEKEVTEPLNTWDELEHVEQDVDALGVEIRYGGNRAYFTKFDDFVQMPDKDQFKDGGAYYATLFHELTHWTGHPSRLDRTFGKSFGDKDYAFEELVAEMGSAFQCAEYGIEGMLQHEAYIQGWITVLKNDKRAIVRAASKAQKAVEFIQEGMQNQGQAQAA